MDYVAGDSAFALQPVAIGQGKVSLDVHQSGMGSILNLSYITCIIIYCYHKLYDVGYIYKLDSISRNSTFALQPVAIGISKVSLDVHQSGIVSSSNLLSITLPQSSTPSSII